MLHFRLASDRPPTILLIGAHCDDIEIGCAGTVGRLVATHPRARFVWVTLASDTVRAAETRASAAKLLDGVEAEVRVEAFRASYFPYCAESIKAYFEQLKSISPDLVLTHCRHDLHQDHRVANELTWNTFRDHTILEYEIPKFDGDLGAPNVFVPLSRADLERKCRLLVDSYRSQANRQWFRPDTFEALARLRGIECNAPEGYAEAFYGRKVCLVP